MRHDSTRAEDLALTGLDLHRDERPRKSAVAEDLGVDPAFFSKLLAPQRYRPRVDSALCDRIAAMWNQSPDYVRSIYPGPPDHDQSSDTSVRFVSR